MPEKIADLGFEDDTPRLTPKSQEPTSLDLTSQQYFMMSRVDGATTLKTLCNYSGLSLEEAVHCLQTLHDMDLVDLPNREKKQPLKPRPSGEATAPAWPTLIESFELEPEDLATASALSPAMRRLVVYYHHHLELLSFYDLFQVARTAPTKEITDAYYKLCKLFHPDRWFRQDLGSLESRLRAVFRWINGAYRTLSKPKSRVEYDALVERGYVGPWELEAEERQASGRTGTFRIVQQGPNSVARSALEAQGRRFSSKRLYPEASDCYRRALQMSYTVKTALDLAGALLEGGLDLEEARELVTTVQEGDSGRHAAMLLEAKILRKQGDPAAARERCAAILAENPRYPGAAEEMLRLKQTETR